MFISFVYMYYIYIMCKQLQRCLRTAAVPQVVEVQSFSFQKHLPCSRFSLDHQEVIETESCDWVSR